MIMQIAHIEMTKVLVDEEFNCRGPITHMDVADLAKDIAKRGMIQPVVVTPLKGDRKMKHPDKEYLLIAGYRRFTAFEVNKETIIPAVVREDIGDEADARIFNLSENLQRKQLNMLQESRALAQLERLGVNEVEAGQKLGMSRGWVQVRYMVLRLPELIQEEIAAGWFNQTQIRDIYSHLKNVSKEACIEVAKKFKNDKLAGRKGTRKKVKKKTQNEKRIRDRQDIFELQGHVYSEFGGNNIITKMLAWCAGESADSDRDEAIREFAAREGKTYKGLK